jgi:hypothetical protein
MANIPYKLQLSKGSNNATIEIDDINNITVSDPNIILSGSVNINSLYTLPQSSPSSDGNYVLNSNNNILSFNQVSSSISQFQYNFYVSTSGNDSNNGSISSPYKTIGACMTYINTLSADVNVSINLSSGTYNEAVLINKSGVSIIGTSSTGCIITGDVGINMTQNSSFYSIAEISNVQIVGQISQLNATLYTNSLVLSNVVIAPPAGFNAISINSTGGGFLADCTIKNSSVIYANNNTIAILLTNGAITMIGSQITNNPTLSNTIEPFIKANGSSRVNLFGSSLIQNSTSASVKALIEIANTANATSSSTINNCILTYTASTAAALGAIMNFSNSASANTYNFYLNYCKCNYSVGIGGQNYIVGKTSTGSVNFTFGNNLGTAGNHTVPNSGFTTGWTRTLMNAIV